MLIKEIDANKIEQNWETYKQLLLSTNREGIDDLIDYLENKSDFRYAPASTKYHGSFKGGLCEHSLTVYNILKELNIIYSKFSNTSFDDVSLILVALLHDISKINCYEETVVNKKIYNDTGSKFDELGSFDWVSVKSYKLKDADQRFVFVNHETTSEFITRQFIDLKIEESIAIMTHHNGIGFDTIKQEAMGTIYQQNPLALLLHEADLMAAYVWA